MKELQKKSLLTNSNISITVTAVCVSLITYSFFSMLIIGRLRRSSSETVLFVVDINSAPPSELSVLPGIGSELAKKIVSHREEFGEFGNLNDLKKVSGIGDKKIRQIRSHICFSNIVGR